MSKSDPSSPVEAASPRETPKPQDRDFATVISCIQKIVTMPDREHTHIPTRDLKAFARLVTAQCEELAALTARVAELEGQLKTLGAQNDQLRAVGAQDEAYLGRLREENERLRATLAAIHSWRLSASLTDGQDAALAALAVLTSAQEKA